MQYNYSISNDFPYNRIISRQLEADINTAGIPGLENIGTSEDDCMLVFASELSEQHKSELDAIIAAHPGLATLKFEKSQQIDARTDQLIELGFNWDGNQYSMSIEAQSRMLGLYVLKDHPMAGYPISWNSLNDDESCSLDNADEVTAFFLTAVGTYRSYIDSGTALKVRVRSAANKTELDAIIDAR